jgi:VWFA-related protein
MIAPGLRAQTTEPLRLSVTTRLVQVSVVVQGKGGRPADDLTKDNFTVFDNGKPQVITSFVRSAGERPAEPAAAPRRWSNRVQSSADTPRTVTAILFDGLNTNIKDQVYLKDQILRFLRKLRPGDSVALYTLTTDLRVLHDFTDDNQALMQALEGERPKMLAQWSRETVGGAIRGALRKDRAAFTLEALRAVGEHLSRIPGRKNLVWMTSGFPMTIAEYANGKPIYNHDNRPLMAATARAVADAGVSVYPVSALGLIGQPENSVTQGNMRSPGPGRSMSTVAGPQIVNSRQTGPLHDMMLSMAEQTGGRAFTERNDLDAALQESMRDLVATYTITFHPSHDQWNGDFRPLRVQVNRKGLKLRHRPGYVAAPEGPADTRDADAVLKDALDNPLDSAGIGLEVAVAGEDASGTRLSIRVDLPGITLEPSGGRWKGALLLAAVPLSSGEAIPPPDVRKVAVDLSQERYDQVVKAGAAFEHTVPSADFHRGVRVFVLDVASRRVGSVNVRPRKGLPD